ncbi:hypothetical protein SAICODRAFT_27881 [Saitoella complicata NRRL Y-17804]|uniref:IPT/TIG domain-containing protein n=1 Tax=Saitoella complicata (strain BCRC 22490 / CBS 7301 / JCM 7358 / NBRC 10748 / NRRL Y-17804) TaxID=698492 RepID=A0A0E9NJB3_SAICN|nr:uncharacterized protein SAICODRAFT_27881 [Saitoella complicata NRRL Y-17804]ODQ50192.1 hypothetical protein SAICODRAFT_27881 [Saitoella complicata NRRL Y-17804]GAO49957.1 hypothetical protein G7K_4092-t1 [Saitoella complicata NRRL Y-17804]
MSENTINPAALMQQVPPSIPSSQSSDTDSGSPASYNIDEHLENGLRSVTTSEEFSMHFDFESAASSPGPILNGGLKNLEMPSAPNDAVWSASGPFLASIPAGLKMEEEMQKGVAVQTVSMEDIMLGTAPAPSGCLEKEMGHNDMFGQAETGMLDTIMFAQPGIVNSNMPDDRDYLLNIIGIPDHGAKSRVETQIKITLQLCSSSGMPLRYTHLQLPEYAIAKEKLKVRNMKEPAKGWRPENIAVLEALVVCASDGREVTICAGCIQRERKRAQRKKEYKRVRPDPTTDADGAVQSDEPPILPDEERKILMFNTTELCEFDPHGQIVVPTRITCYCRHHKEKVGFIMKILIRDPTGTIIARANSPIVMITDDHKTTSKVKGTSTAGTSPRDPNTFMEEIMSSALTSTAPSPPLPAAKRTKRGNSLSNGSTTAGPGGPIKTTRKKRSPQQSMAGPSKLPTNLAMTKLNIPTTPTSAQILPAGYEQKSPLQHEAMNIPMSGTSTGAPSMVNTGPPTPDSVSAANRPPLDLSNLLFENYPNTAPSSRMSSPAASLPPHTSPQMQMQPVMQTPQEQLHQMNMFDVANAQFGMDGMEHVPLPMVSRLIPCEGPTHGGIEVTVLGNNFVPGVTVMFGEVPAVSTVCWSPTTLVCVLPPACAPGAVVVGFGKQIMGQLTNGMDTPSTAQRVFTYFDETDRALMELALQVVGLKMTGRLEDARQIAMRIVGVGAQGGQMQGASQGQIQQNLRTMLANGVLGVTDGEDLEGCLLRCLDMIDLDTSPHPARLNHRNRAGHNMLHLATMCGYQRLVAALLARGAQTNGRDKNGYTPLHFAASTGHGGIVARLLGAGADVNAVTSGGLTPLKLARLGGWEAVVEALTAGRTPVAVPVTQPSHSRSSSVSSAYTVFSHVDDEEESDDTVSVSGLEWLEGMPDYDSDEQDIEEEEEEEVWVIRRRSRSASRVSSRGRPAGITRTKSYSEVQVLRHHHRKRSGPATLADYETRISSSAPVTPKTEVEGIVSDAHTLPEQPPTTSTTAPPSENLHHSLAEMLASTSAAIWSQLPESARIPNFVRQPANYAWNEFPASMAGLNALLAQIPRPSASRTSSSTSVDGAGGREGKAGRDQWFIPPAIKNLFEAPPPPYSEHCAEGEQSAGPSSVGGAEEKAAVATQSSTGTRWTRLRKRWEARKVEVTPEQAEMIRAQRKSGGGDRMLYLFWLPVLMLIFAMFLFRFLARMSPEMAEKGIHLAGAVVRRVRGRVGAVVMGA